MCRGRNGQHIHVAPGVSYCTAGEALHVEVDEFYFGTNLAYEPYGRAEIAWAVSTCFMRFAVSHPHCIVRKVSVKGIDGNARRTTCHAK